MEPVYSPGIPIEINCIELKKKIAGKQTCIACRLDMKVGASVVIPRSNHPNGWVGRKEQTR